MKAFVRLDHRYDLCFWFHFSSLTNLDSATLMHALLYFRKQIWVQSRRSLSEQPDVHARLMSRYPQGTRLPLFPGASLTCARGLGQFLNGGILSSFCPCSSLVLLVSRRGPLRCQSGPSCLPSLSVCPMSMKQLRGHLPGPVFSVYLRDSGRYDSGHHKPANWVEVSVRALWSTCFESDFDSRNLCSVITELIIGYVRWSTARRILYR